MKESYKNILVAIDGSKQAHHAFQEAIEVTKRNNGHLYVLAVSDTSRLIGEPYAVNSVLESAKEATHAIMDTLKAELPDDIEHTEVIEEGNPKPTICDYAKDHEIDLIVIGTTGTGAFSRLMLGSTTAYVVNNAPCNVMVVR